MWKEDLSTTRAVPEEGEEEVRGGTGDKLGGNLRSREQRPVERAQEEIGGKGDCTEEKGAGGPEEGSTGAAPL